MRKILSGIFFFWCCTAAWGNESDWNKAFNIIWESRWQQNGILLPATRWPDQNQTIKYSINSSASSTNARRVREAVGSVTQIIGWKAIEVPEGSADVQLEVTLRQYRDEELRQFICHVVPTINNGHYSKVKMMLSEQYAYRCILHELMHAFGFPGHPQGNTVLSYFEGNQNSLRPLDEFLLQGWYSDRIKVNAPPLSTIQELTKLWVEKTVPPAQQDQAKLAQQKWFQDLIKSMDDFAFNKGQPPTILYRSGLISEEGIRFGRSMIQSMLGFDYLFGFTTEKNSSKAAQLLLMSAESGSTFAAMLMAKQLSLDSWDIVDSKPLCIWLYNTPSFTTRLNTVDQKAALESKVCTQVLRQ